MSWDAARMTEWYESAEGRAPYMVESKSPVAVPGRIDSVSTAVTVGGVKP